MIGPDLVVTSMAGLFWSSAEVQRLAEIWAEESIGEQPGAAHKMSGKMWDCLLICAARINENCRASYYKWIYKSITRYHTQNNPKWATK